jgi:hypothetical protein
MFESDSRKRIAILSAVALLCMLTFRFFREQKVQVENSDVEFEAKPAQTKSKKKLSSSRSPASVDNTNSYISRSGYSVSERTIPNSYRPSNPSEPHNFDEVAGNSESNNIREGYADAEEPPSEINYYYQDNPTPTSLERAPAASSTQSNKTNSGGVPLVESFETQPYFDNQAPTESVGKKPTDDLNCNASIGAGSYATPQNVSLSCSSSASIKYCISENVCCDPDSGLNYSGPLQVGQGPKTYCLSFRGTANDGGNSDIVELMYTFSPGLPDISVAHTKVFYQTTELAGRMSLASTDFGNNNYSGGAINLKNHDPGISGLNWNCDDAFNNYSTLNTSAPSVLLPDMNVAGVSSASQINVDFDSPQMIYGENHIMSYMRNNLFSELVLACSFSKVTLYDFPYFSESPSHGETGTNQVREFAGGFSHIGFFEAESTLYSGTVGTSASTNGSQELKSGLFKTFY